MWFEQTFRAETVERTVVVDNPRSVLVERDTYYEIIGNAGQLLVEFLNRHEGKISRFEVLHSSPGLVSVIYEATVVLS